MNWKIGDEVWAVGWITGRVWHGRVEDISRVTEGLIGIEPHGAGGPLWGTIQSYHTYADAENRARVIRAQYAAVSQAAG